MMTADEWRHEPGALPASYEDAALPVVNVQLERAGAAGLSAQRGVRMTAVADRRSPLLDGKRP